MYDDYRKGDTKCFKTEHALNIALRTLLQKRSFEKITVRDICDNAWVSRAAFYAHYTDKYDLLKRWVMTLIPKDTEKVETYEQFVKAVDEVVKGNEKLFRNLIRDAGKDTMNALFEVLYSVFNHATNPKENDPRTFVFSAFYTGGLMHYISCRIENKFPSDVALVNVYLYEIIKFFNTFKV